MLRFHTRHSLRLVQRQRSVLGELVGVLLVFLGHALPAHSSALHDHTLESGNPIVRSAPLGIHQFPFLSTTLNLAARGYSEAEFLFSGTAQAYVNVGSVGADGCWDVTPNPGVTAPYTLRLLVRRPADRGRAYTSLGTLKYS